MFLLLYWVRKINFKFFSSLTKSFFFICSMSAIDFFCSVDKVKGVDGKDRVVLTFDGKYLPHTEQVSCFPSLLPFPE